MRILFVRHGHPDYERDCLTALGQRHAAAAAERLREEGIGRIFSSTCGRAMETASYTARRLNIGVEEKDFMREISWGSTDHVPLYEDGHPWTTAERIVEDGQPLLDTAWAEKEPFGRNRVVENAALIAAATDEWLGELGYIREGLYYRVKNVTERTIAVFGHGGASAAMLSHLFNLPFPFTCLTLGLDYTGITVVTLAEEPGRLISPKFELVNDARHIQGFRVENVYGN